MSALATSAAGSVPVGYEGLIRRFQLGVPPLRSVSMGTIRKAERHVISADGSERIELPLESLGDTGSLAVQLTFALKREPLDLSVLAALFEHQEALDAVQRWLHDVPASKYARLSGHLATWLTGYRFDYTIPPGTRRTPVLDPEKYVTGPAVSDTQFGITNNLLGTREFCPLIRRTERLEALLAEDLGAKVVSALGSLEPEMLARAVDFLYVAETRSTYSIEDEVPSTDRAAKFRRLLEQAGEPGRLSEDQLTEWQARIVGTYAVEMSYRNEQNWLSRPGTRLRNIADFIPPPPALVDPMMAGVAEVAERTRLGALHPVLGATCAAFGLVFVHPFLDGNGRLHRFLLHHVLRQAGFTPAGVVLPLSARMLRDQARYAALLKSYSKPRTELLEYAMDADSSTILVRSAQPLWLYAYFDATALCEFILECVRRCVDEDLQQEVAYLQAFDNALRDVEGWLDMRQSTLHALINVIVQGGGTLSKNKRAKLAEALDDRQVQMIEAAVRRNFEGLLAR